MTNQFAPYIGFSGNAKEALEFYQQILGGEIDVTTFADGGVLPAGEPLADKYMHAEFRSDYAVIFATDQLTEVGAPPLNPGDNISLALMLDDVELGRKLFEALGEGGKIDMPYETQSWGGTFGAIIDRFGIPWMVHATDGAAHQ